MVTTEVLPNCNAVMENLYVQWGPVIQWIQDNWVTIALTGEMVGAVLAVKMGAYRRGIGWLVAALATLWLGWSP